MDDLKKKVDELYQIQDNYFSLFPLNEAKLKVERLKNKLTEVINYVNSAEETLTNSTEYHLLKGKALNVLDEYDNGAMDCLTRCVKLDPKLGEAWNQLGICYWKNQQLDEAKNSFKAALNCERNKSTLRNMSMLLRQQNGTNEEKIKNLEESFKYAKEAIQCDVSDEESWIVLGNTYMSKFFTEKQDYHLLEQCLNAFNQADKNYTSFDYSLYFNKGNVHMYLLQFEQTLKSYHRAAILNPIHEDVFEKETDVIKFLTTIQMMVDTKAKLKGRQLRQMLSNMNLDNELSCVASFYPTLTYKLQNIEDLRPGLNSGALLSCKVIGAYFTDNSIYFTFCAMDKNEQCFVVFVYNCAQSWGVKISDLISIPDPFLVHSEFTHNNKEFNFDAIRVLSPSALLVNQKAVKKSDIVSAQISFTSKA